MVLETRKEAIVAGFIRGIDPRDNTYTYAHAAGKHFRSRATQAHRPTVSITLSKTGARIQTTFIPLRRGPKTAREMGLAPILMVDKD